MCAWMVQERSPGTACGLFYRKPCLHPHLRRRSERGSGNRRAGQARQAAALWPRRPAVGSVARASERDGSSTRRWMARELAAWTKGEARPRIGLAWPFVIATIQSSPSRQARTGSHSDHMPTPSLFRLSRGPSSARTTVNVRPTCDAETSIEPHLLALSGPEATPPPSLPASPPSNATTGNEFKPPTMTLARRLSASFHPPNDIRPASAKHPIISSSPGTWHSSFLPQHGRPVF